MNQFTLSIIVLAWSLFQGTIYAQNSPEEHATLMCLHSKVKAHGGDLEQLMNLMGEYEQLIFTETKKQNNGEKVNQEALELMARNIDQLLDQSGFYIEGTFDVSMIIACLESNKSTTKSYGGLLGHLHYLNTNKELIQDIAPNITLSGMRQSIQSEDRGKDMYRLIGLITTQGIIHETSKKVFKE